MTFQFREDGFFNMTKAAKHFGKRLDNFMANVTTGDYLLALARATETTWDSSEFTGRDAELEAARSILTGRFEGRNGGTWGHPKLAVFFARWLDVKFAVWCDMVIDDLLRGKAEVTITKPDT